MKKLSKLDILRSLQTADGRTLQTVDLRNVVRRLGGDLDKLPFAVRILLENASRAYVAGIAEPGDLDALANWKPDGVSDHTVPFMPARILLQDFTGVPVVADLAAMRDACLTHGSDPTLINPSVRSDLVIDHSVQVDAYGSAEALAQNIRYEYERNGERYRFLKWAQKAFNNFRVVPPGAGIVHQINLEYLGDVVTVKDDTIPTAFPDTCIGADSHTTMINGIGVLGWGAGGIEIEAVMLGEPYFLQIPQVVGVQLTGRLSEGVTATDLVLTITEKLRSTGVVAKFVEFFGPGLEHVAVEDRATIANMSPEFGSTCAFFPVDQHTLSYLKRTGRGEKQIDLVKKYCQQTGLWNEWQTSPEYSQVVTLDLTQVEPSLAGPKRPQDRVALRAVPASFAKIFQSNGTGDAGQTQLSDGDVVIAAITSCTNTSNPWVMLGAGLMARKAVGLKLRCKPWVKTSLAPGSQVVTDYLNLAGLSQPLSKLGFDVVGYGCTTCIGNSGPLDQAVATAIKDNDLAVVAVLSGNRNFEGRIHPQVRASYIASPMLVIAYALAGSIKFDLTSQPLGTDDQGKPIFMRDIWPSKDEIETLLNKVITPKMFTDSYAKLFAGGSEWNALDVEGDVNFVWDADSTYVRRPPFLDNFGDKPPEFTSVVGARVLVKLGDSVTTDHISPAGSIPPTFPAGQYLRNEGVKLAHFNTFGARRGNHEVMLRGTFGNIRLRNLLLKDPREGDWTTYFPDDTTLHIYEAALKYKQAGVPLIVLAGRNYGAGSSRDWAAKGPSLLGVRAVIAESYERIHRSNLIGMGILPLEYVGGANAESLGLTGSEIFHIHKLGGGPHPNSVIEVDAEGAGGKRTIFEVRVRLDSQIECDYINGGGILPYVLRKTLRH